MVERPPRGKCEAFAVCHRVKKKSPFGAFTSEPTAEELRFANLWYFYQAALLNEGSVVDAVDFMIEQRGDLAAIGASGCLAALDALLPLHAEAQQLAEGERGEYWRRHIPERLAADELVEGCVQFGRLLLDYAQKNADRIG